MIKPRPTIRSMKKYEPPLENRREKIRLDFNENLMGCSPKAIEAIKNATSDDISAYPEYGKFRQKLAGYLGVNAGEVLLTNGTDEAIRVVIDAYLEKGDEIVMPVPTFTMFEVYASISGCRVEKVLYNEDLSFPTAKVLDNISGRTRLVVIVNPNNPTGTSASMKDVIKIIEKARNAIVLVDEAYFQYCGKSSKDLIRKYRNLIVLQTFSKAFGLAGMRIGCAISNEGIIGELEKAISPYSVSSLSVLAASAALDDVEFVNRCVRETKSNMRHLESELKKLKIKTYPSEANFIVVNFGSDCEFVRNKLSENGVLVRDRSKFPLMDGCLRITIGSKEQCKLLVREIKNALAKKTSGAPAKTLLFDMDGVLVDVSKSYRIAIKRTAEFFTGRKVGGDEIQKLKERGGFNSDWDLAEAIVRKSGAAVPRENIIEKFQKIYLGSEKKAGLIENEKWMIPPETLAELSKKYRLGIVTGRPRNEAEYALNKSGAARFFETVVAMEDVPEGKAKPDPFGINLAMKLMGVESAVYIGDSVDDIKAAGRAGISSVGVLPPNVKCPGLKSRLAANGAMAILGDLKNIECALEALE